MPRAKKSPDKAKSPSKNRAKKTVAAVAAPASTKSSPWKLFKQSLRDYRTNWRLILKLMLIITAPVAILSNLGLDTTGDSTFSAYLAFAQLCMNVALIYAIIELLNGRSVSVRQAYYKGSAMLVRLALVTLLLFFMAVFLLISGVILAYGIIAPGTQLTAVEQALLAVLAIAIAIPSVVLLIRGVFAIYVLFETEQGPVQAVRTSRQLTKGRVLVTLGRLLALVGFLLLLIILPILILVPLQIATQWIVFTMLLQAATSLIVLPITNFYLYRYYQGLK
ncbi:MAG TPA: hypothetical protein VMR75_02530 [Candidatus Saccharimonadales bacterium]|nr:hypothetical protein [Candidatus Saccharimonadales bacterium]